MMNSFISPAVWLRIFDEFWKHLHWCSHSTCLQLLLYLCSIKGRIPLRPVNEDQTCCVASCWSL